jgi:glyoxylase-like metal-dependent hydrolase (beta-lactamase superfamily II)
LICDQGRRIIHDGGAADELPERNPADPIFDCADRDSIIMMASKLIIKQIELGPMQNFVYLVGCSATKEAAVVDPAWDVPSIVESAKESGFRVDKIFLTHSHPDHMNGLQDLLEATDARVYIHSAEKDYMDRLGDYFRATLDLIARNSSRLYYTADADEVRVGGLSVKLLHTPGHTPGSQCFLTDNCLISGDTLFVNSCGRVDLPLSDPERMWWSLNRKLKTLPDETIVCPGHNYGRRTTSTIGDEKRKNPFMQHASAESFLQMLGSY